MAKYTSKDREKRKAALFQWVADVTADSLSPEVATKKKIVRRRSGTKKARRA